MHASDGDNRRRRIAELPVKAGAGIDLADAGHATPLQYAGMAGQEIETILPVAKAAENSTRGREKRKTVMGDESRFLCEAIELARANIGKGGRPFGAVLVRDGEVIAAAANEIHATCDPTSHAEMNAIRAASRKLGSPDLRGSAVYASGHPCPMCLAAMRLCGVDKVFYAYSNDDGAPFGLSTAAIYEDLARPFAEQSMTICYLPVRPENQADLYAQWVEAQGRPK